MTPPEEMPVSTVKVMFERIQKDLDEIKADHKEDKKALHNRCNTIETCINAEVKPKVQGNRTDVDWLKRGFWFIAGVGSSALFLVVGVVIKLAWGV
jgi:hypothetical protein